MWRLGGLDASDVDPCRQGVAIVFSFCCSAWASEFNYSKVISVVMASCIVDAVTPSWVARLC